MPWCTCVGVKINFKTVLSVTSPASSVDVGLVAGIAGGVGGALFLVIIVLVIVVFVLVCQVRRRGHIKFVSGELQLITRHLTCMSVLIHVCKGKSWVLK